MRNLFENLALIAMTDMLLSSMVENESRTARRPTFIREDSRNCGCTHKPTSRFFAEHLTPREDKKWGVCECNPREDRNKRFGIPQLMSLVERTIVHVLNLNVTTQSSTVLLTQ